MKKSRMVKISYWVLFWATSPAVLAYEVVEVKGGATIVGTVTLKWRSAFPQSL